MEFMSPSQFLKLVRKDFDYAAAHRTKSGEEKHKGEVLPT
jgi:hypothetical protein